MNGRRTLGDLLTELADSAAVFAGAAAASPVRARSLSLSLPIDLRLAPNDRGLEVIGDVPLFLTRTDFDPDLARLEVHWQAIPYPTAEAS